MDSSDPKLLVREHWEQEVCGSRYGSSPDRRRYFEEIDLERYSQEPMLKQFANFEGSKGKRVLEIGLGTGADFIQWARAGALAHGRDLTEASVNLVNERLELEELTADVRRGDAEALDFPDDYFDVVYSWGVLMCTPQPEKAFAEAYRVLKPGGSLKMMLYNARSVTALLVWLAHGPVRGNFSGVRNLYQQNVESPGTKIYSERDVRRMLEGMFVDRPIEIHTYLGAGDVLEQKLSPRYSHKMWRVAQALYPSWFVRNVVGNRFGTEMTIHAVK